MTLGTGMLIFACISSVSLLVLTRWLIELSREVRELRAEIEKVRR